VTIIKGQNIYPHKSQLGKNFDLKEEIISAILFAKGAVILMFEVLH
jgi:hypothetical protein